MITASKIKYKTCRPFCSFTFVVCLFITAISHHIALSQPQDESSLPEGHYVIIGVFAIKNNAVNFIDAARKDGLTAKHAFNRMRKLYYVYLDVDSNLASGVAMRDSIRRIPKYRDTWIKHLPEISSTSKIAATITVDSEAVALSSNEITPSAIMPSEEATPDSTITLAPREVFLSLYNQSSDRVVEGKVQIVDTERSRLITLLNGNEYTSLPDPKSKSRQLTLICDASGYRKIQHEVNYDTPLTEDSQEFLEEIGTTLVINFPLTRYQKGDIYALYSVYFYNDAAIFLPESKFELNELLVMMQENPKIRIRLHGHSNGNSFGKIITVGSTGDRFSLSKDARVTKGSSKELSEKRAELIRDFLVDNGIPSDRIETKAWGGKRPLHDKNSANAKKNVRVEVEILETK